MRPIAGGQAPRTGSVSEALLAAEAAECQTVVANVFGYHSIQISPWSNIPDMLATAQTVSCHHLQALPSGRIEGSFSGELFELPVQDESVSLVVLHHVHELFGGRHGLLSELHRILRPDGIVVMIGYSRWARNRPPECRPLAPAVLAQRLYGFDLQTLMVRPLSHRGHWWATLIGTLTRHWNGGAWLGNLGQSYLLLARKSSRGSPIFPMRSLPLRQIKGAIGASTSSFTAEPGQRD